jgi:hypothetical protein
VYNAQDYWDFGLYPLPGILRNTKEHSVLETGWTKFKIPIILSVVT